MKYSSKGRLQSIDLLRGVAALGVLLYHAYDAGLFQPSLPPHSLIETILLLPISYGYVGVYLFFVISGFCIHLRLAKSISNEGISVTIKFVPFWKRRICRLYPAYLAALVLYLFVLWYKGKLVVSLFLVWDVVSHLLMIHNIDARTVYSLNGVFWTLAIEEQLYLAYFLLIWLKNRLGWAKIILLTGLIRVLWFSLFFALHRVLGIEIVVSESAAANWCIWVLGAIAVEWYLGLVRFPSWLFSKVLLVFAWFFTMALTYLDFFSTPYSVFHRLAWLILQPMWGVASFLLIITIVSLERKWAQSDRQPVSVAILAGVGLFSYSLYLTHEMVFLLSPLTPFLSVFVCLASAVAFFWLFEKPFLLQSGSRPVEKFATVEG